MSVLKLKLAEGRKELDSLESSDMKDGHFFYVKNLSDVVELIFNENKQLFRRYSDHEDTYLRGVKKMDDSDPYKLFYTAEIKLQWALVKMIYGDEIKAGWSLRSAHHTILKNIKQFPDFQDNNKTLGLLKILFASIPENYQWASNLLGMKGSVTEGWETLEQVPKDSPFWYETALIKSVISINVFNKEDETLERLEKLNEIQKDNVIAKYLRSFALIKAGRSEEGAVNLRKLLYLNADYLFVKHVYYQLGEINIQKGNYDLARYYYSKFLNHYEGVNFVKDVWYKIFLTYWLEGDDSMADVHYKKASNSGRAFLDADKNASSTLNQDEYPDRNLMKLRLATDGGYYDLAENLAAGIFIEDYESKKLKTEFNYRLARLNHKRKNMDEAVFYYLNTTKKSGKATWYFAPNSCLNLGYIYREKEDYVKAEYYFKKVLTYKKYPYKSGITTKAKAALSRLSGKNPVLPVQMKF